MLRNRNFLLLWLAQCISRAGDTFTFLAIAIRIDSLFERAEDSARALGGVLFAFALPVLVLGLFAGTLVDRMDRRRVMVAADLGRAALVPAFLLLREPSDLPWAYGIAFLLSSFSVFFYPARTALLPRLVAADDLMSANGWLQLGDTIARVSGPVLAGIVVGRWGTSAAFWVDGASFAASAFLLLAIAGVVTRLQLEGATQQTPWNDLLEGLRFAARSRLLQGVSLGVGIAILGIGGIDTLLVPFLRHTFGTAPEALGAVMTVQGLGMLVGGVAVSRWGKRVSPLTMSVVSMLLLAAGIALAGLAPTYGVFLALAPLIGLAIPPVNASLQTMLQRGISGGMLGRAGAVTDMALTVCQLVSVSAAGWVAAGIGIRPTFVVGGGLMALGGLALWWMLGTRRSQAVAAQAVKPQAYPAD